MLVVFLLIIWLAQIIRYLDISQSFTMQFGEVAIITSYLIPNAISAVLPIIVYIASCFFNYQLNQTNELSILSIYLSRTNLNSIIIYIYFLLSIFYCLNTEIISVGAYNKYKKEEIELRNQFKIRNFNNEIYIKGKLNLFYDSKNNNSGFENVTTYLIEENVVIKSQEVRYTQYENELIFTFTKGIRIASSSNEKSYTDFDKLDYKIINNSENKISLDKENYNIFQLLKHKNVFFNKSAHKRVIDIFMLIIILNISGKILFINNKSKNLIKNYSYNLMLIITYFSFIAFVTSLFLSNTISVKIFYILSISIILLITLISQKKIAFI
tara:strand:+ start:76 stop:1053 length:978 start_codon:yes stop_codon:yes gene_type:complete